MLAGWLVKILPGVLLRHAQRLRFPHLFLLFLGLLVVNVLVPDPMPFIDELILAVITLLFSAWKRRREGGDV